LLDERLDVAAQVIEIAILVGVDFFSLERFHEALTTGIGEGRRLHRMTTMAIPLLKSSTHTIR
jgi:hypothetical protein